MKKRNVLMAFVIGLVVVGGMCFSVSRQAMGHHPTWPIIRDEAVLSLQHTVDMSKDVLDDPGATPEMRKKIANEIRVRANDLRRLLPELKGLPVPTDSIANLQECVDAARIYLPQAPHQPAVIVITKIHFVIFKIWVKWLIIYKR